MRTVYHRTIHSQRSCIGIVIEKRHYSFGPVQFRRRRHECVIDCVDLCRVNREHAGKPVASCIGCIMRQARRILVVREYRIDGCDLRGSGRK